MGIVRRGSKKTKSVKKKKSRIIFFDSGAGGLTVLNLAMAKMPNESYVYYADTQNAPYGTKSKKEIKKLVHKAIKKLDQTYKIKALVIACNTATSAAIQSLRKKYSFPIVGMEPAVKVAVDQGHPNKILVCATNVTLKEKKLSRLIKRLSANDKVNLLPLQELVQFAEKKDFNSKELRMYLTYKFSKINWFDYDSLVLGCTHFLYFKEILSTIVPAHIDILDGNKGTIKNLSKRINPAKKEKRKTKYIITGHKKNKKYCQPFLVYLNQN